MWTRPYTKILAMRVPELFLFCFCSSYQKKVPYGKTFFLQIGPNWQMGLSKTTVEPQEAVWTLYRREGPYCPIDVHRLFCVHIRADMFIWMNIL